jgi:host factor-I protein
MSVTGTDIQTGFLRTLINERKVVWIFLVNGIKLTGQLASFDKYVIALESPTGMQTVFKSAVSTVGEAHAVERPQTGARPAIPPERQTALGSPTLVDGRPHSTLRSRRGMVLGRLNEPREIASLDRSAINPLAPRLDNHSRD